MSLLSRFYAEVTDRGPEACLPRSLSDEWLRVVAASLDELLARDGDEDVRACCGAEPKSLGVAAVLTLLRAKTGRTTALDVDLENLWEHLTQYRIELGLEEVHRFTDIKYEQASLETIFTNRTVRTWRVE